MVHVERAACEIYLGIRPLEVELGGSNFVERQDGLDEARHAGGCIQMSDIGFDRTDGAEAFLLRPGPESFRQGGNFDRIAQLRSCSVGFHVSDRFRYDVSHDRAARDHLRLAFNAGRCVAHFLTTVIVDRRSFYDGIAESPSARASANLFSTTTPTPLPKVPRAVASKAQQRPSGEAIPS